MQRVRPMCVWDVCMLLQTGNVFAGWFTGRSRRSAVLRCRKHFVRRWGRNGIGRPRYSARVVTPAEYMAGRPAIEGLGT